MKRIGFISPLLPEARCLTPRPPPPCTLTALDNRCSLYISGMGRERADHAAREMAYSGIEVLISWGTAGGISAELQPGDLLVPELILSQENRVFRTDERIRATLLGRLNNCPANIYVGALAECTTVLHDPGGKSDLARQDVAQAVDMESAAIAAVAAEHNLAFIALRTIVDPAGMPIPEMVMQTVDQFGEMRLLPLLGKLGQNPGQLLQMLRLAAAFRSAAGTLRWLGKRYATLLEI